jgi:hypothetical protein
MPGEHVEQPVPITRKMRLWNWRKIAYFGALVLDVPILISGASIFGTFLAIIWVAASRTRRIQAWLDRGTASAA